MYLGQYGPKTLNLPWEVASTGLPASLPGVYARSTTGDEVLGPVETGFRVWGLGFRGLGFGV